MSEETIQREVSTAGVEAGFDPDQASPEECIRRARAPVLLVHGTGDWLIPYRHSEDLHRTRPAGTELLLLGGVGHNGIFRDPGGRVSAAAAEWFDQWLRRVE